MYKLFIKEHHKQKEAWLIKELNKRWYKNKEKNMNYGKRKGNMVKIEREKKKPWLKRILGIKKKHGKRKGKLRKGKLIKKKK